MINEQYHSLLEQIINEAKVSGEVDVTGNGRCDHSALFDLHMDSQSYHPNKKLLNKLHMKWKPVYIYMQHSGLVRLPSERPLSDYRCNKPLVSGVDKQCIWDIAGKFRKQDVSILVDVIKISAGLTTVRWAMWICRHFRWTHNHTLFDAINSNSPQTASHALCFLQSSGSGCNISYTPPKLRADVWMVLECCCPLWAGQTMCETLCVW